MIPLFQQYPVLEERLPYASLGVFPTPVRKLEHLGATLDLDGLYVKLEGLAGPVYGGNKVRKLEFLLGRALRAEAREVMTFGCAGSNHALATAVYARQVGMRSISMLLPQPNARYVRRNLLMSHRYEAELHWRSSPGSLTLAALGQLLRHKLTRGRFPQVVPVGGSSPLGTVGVVGGGFELKAQVDRGELPEPDLLYVALGSLGTAVGLTLGCKAAGLKTRVVPVRVVPKELTPAAKFVKLFRRTNDLLRKAAPSFPEIPMSEAEAGIVDDFLGLGYAVFTDAGMAAVRRIEETEGIHIEGTYTGKTLAALLDAAERGALHGKTVLFWDSYNARDFSDAIAGMDYHELPRPFHRYFEEPVQPLDGED